MKALIIMLIIFAFFAFLLIIPVNIHISFQEKLALKIKWVFLSFKPLPKKLKKMENSEINKEVTKLKDKCDENKSNNIKDLIKQTGLDGFLEILFKISELCKNIIKTIMKHTVIKDFNLEISVSGEDASKTALYYAGVCSTVYPSVNVIINAVKKYNNYDVLISPNFQKSKSKVNFNSHLKIRLFFLLIGFIIAIFKFLKIILKIKKNNI